MLQSKVLLSTLCLFLAYSCAQAWNFALEEERIDKEGEFPWRVFVGTRCYPPLGGGSVISKHTVLTAWKAIEGIDESQLVVRINDDLMDYTTILSVRSVVRHPNFNQTTGAYNLALLFLKKPIELTSKIAPINFATSTKNLDLTSCIVKGKGMKTLPLPVVSTATCQQELRRWLGASFQLDDSLICAGGGIGRNVCDEDGFALVCPLARDPSQFQQVGIVNWHINCGATATPDVYTNVVSLSGWINQQIGLNPFVDGPANETNEEIDCGTDMDPHFRQPSLELDFVGSDFPGPDFPGPDLPESVCPGAGCPEADNLMPDFPGADSLGVDYSEADSLGADFPGADSMGVVLPGADFPGEDSPGADSSGADFPGEDSPGEDSPGEDSPGADSPGPDYYNNLYSME